MLQRINSLSTAFSTYLKYAMVHVRFGNPAAGDQRFLATISTNPHGCFVPDSTAAPRLREGLVATLTTYIQSNALIYTHNFIAVFFTIPHDAIWFNKSHCGNLPGIRGPSLRLSPPVKVAWASHRTPNLSQPQRKALEVKKRILPPRTKTKFSAPSSFSVFWYTRTGRAAVPRG